MDCFSDIGLLNYTSQNEKSFLVKCKMFLILYQILSKRKFPFQLPKTRQERKHHSQLGYISWTS